MKHVMAHDLAPELARKAAERAFESYREKYARYNPQLTWHGEDQASVVFNAKGVHLRANIELLPGKIAFDLEVPFVFRVFQGRAIAIIERELAHWCAEAKRGALG